MTNDEKESLTRVETKLAYLEDFMNKIQTITLENNETLDRLKTENRELRMKLGEIEDNMQEIPNNRPPHY